MRRRRRSANRRPVGRIRAEDGGPLGRAPSRFANPLIPALALIAACGATAAPPTSTAAGSAPGAPTTLVETLPTTAASSPTEVVYEVSSCQSPPVDFALLCDVYELVLENHVDAPFDPAALAAGAAVGVSSYSPTETGDVPASFSCSIPDPAFESICDGLASALSRHGFPIGEAIEKAVASMVTLSLDPFSYYIPPELSGSLSPDGVVHDVGLLLTVSDAAASTCTVVEAGCRLEVVFAVEGGAADSAGLVAGDIITAIDGEPVTGSTLVDVAGALAGQAGTGVTVTVDREGSTQDIEMLREPVTYPTVDVDVPVPGVGYLRIPDFEADIPVLVHTALEELTTEGVGRIVIDLRDNPGGYVDVATLVASEFLADGLVFRSGGRHGDLDYPVQDGGLATSGIPLTVVVNGASASASEILAGVLQERSRATVVGAPTFGKNTVQIGFPLRNDGEFRVTIARWTTPDGASVAIDGVTPDVIVDIPSDASPVEVVELALG